MDDWATQKSTADIERRQTVELVISEENDYGIGNGRLFPRASHADDYRLLVHASPLICSVLAIGSVRVTKPFGCPRHYSHAPAPSAQQE